MTAAPLLAQPSADEMLISIAVRHDAALEGLLKSQITDPTSPWHGMVKNAYGIPSPFSMPGMFDTYASAVLQPKSKFYKNREVVARLRLTAESIKRNQTPAGFLHSLETNFNSPADTGFSIQPAANALFLANKAGDSELEAIMRPYVESAADGLAVGGIHTPNHRWVLCCGLALANEVIPKSAYTRRIDQWLAEGIDIDEDGQFTERSMGTYNSIVDHALLTIAEKRNKPELLDHVRANLNSLLYLINPNGEIVTDFSRRQDQFTRVTPARYYESLHVMAIRDKNPVYGNLAAKYRDGMLGLSMAMRRPELLGPIETAPLPANYRKDFKHNKVTRVRRGNHAATVFYNGGSRVLSLYHGEAVITAVRFISSFFGKGQFRPQEALVSDSGAIQMTQRLEGPYYQPFTPTRTIDSEAWDSTQKLRPRSEISTFEQSAIFTEAEGGYDLRIRSGGTPQVPMIIEIAFREGGSLTGVEPVPTAKDSYLLAKGAEATYRVGGDVIKVSPGISEHAWTSNIRYIEPKLPGPTLFLTGFAPFDQTIKFRFA
jgi:hypothetical protein